jgi:hypothetical protein
MSVKDTTTNTQRAIRSTATPVLFAVGLLLSGCAANNERLAAAPGDGENSADPWPEPDPISSLVVRIWIDVIMPTQAGFDVIGGVLETRAGERIELLLDAEGDLVAVLPTDEPLTGLRLDFEGPPPRRLRVLVGDEELETVCDDGCYVDLSILEGGTPLENLTVLSD